ncbi:MULTISPECIES: ion channel [Alphaproteobacteria]|uniref:ion channel n=1 Tax=Alphaproteobacteria TaxID=28211 RepID=UPI0032994EDC
MYDKIRKVWTEFVSKANATFEAFRVIILGLKGSSTPGSDTRRMTIRLCLYWSLGAFLWALMTATATSSNYSVSASVGSVAFIGASLLIFFQIVLLMPFRDNNDDFQLDAWRLVFDTMISAVFMISVFAVLYKNVGLLSGGEIVRPSLLDAIYFSSVTFSTLGYGDFAPHPSARIIAATQALLGNLHLGMIVGATFAAIKR